MGILQTTLNTIKAGKEEPSKKKSSTGNRRKGASTDSYLLDELDRFSNYILDKNLSKIIDVKSGLKHGVNKIGSKGDSAGVLGFDGGQIFFGTTKKAKIQASKYYVKVWAKNNLTETIQTKTKSVLGKMISKNIYMKEVSYERAGKVVSYLQARNINTGRILSLKIAKMLMGKMK